MSEFDTLADLVDVTEKLIPFNRILGVRNCRIDDDRVARIRVDHRDDLGTLVAVGTGTYIVG